MLYISSEKPTAESSTLHFARISQNKKACLYPALHKIVDKYLAHKMR